MTHETNTTTGTNIGQDQWEVQATLAVVTNAAYDVVDLN